MLCGRRCAFPTCVCASAFFQCRPALPAPLHWPADDAQLLSTVELSCLRRCFPSLSSQVKSLLAERNSAATELLVRSRFDSIVITHPPIRAQVHRHLQLICSQLTSYAPAQKSSALTDNSALCFDRMLRCPQQLSRICFPQSLQESVSASVLDNDRRVAAAATHAAQAAAVEKERCDLLELRRATPTATDTCQYPAVPSA